MTQSPKSYVRAFACGIAVLAAAGILLVAVSQQGCGSRSSAPVAPALKGERETEALLKAMESAVAVKDGEASLLIDALRQVVAADAAVEKLDLTPTEREALNARFGPWKADLQKRFDE